MDNNCRASNERQTLSGVDVGVGWGVTALARYYFVDPFPLHIVYKCQPRINPALELTLDQQIL